MGFGKWLAAERERAGMTQQELADRVGISFSYISALEREVPNARDGSPRRPRVEKVDKIAKALSVPKDEARLAAGFAPANPQTRVHKLITALEAQGEDAFTAFGGFNQLADLTDDQYNRMLESVGFAIQLALRQLSIRPVDKLTLIENESSTDISGTKEPTIEKVKPIEVGNESRRKRQAGQG